MTDVLLAIDLVAMVAGAALWLGAGVLAATTPAPEAGTPAPRPASVATGLVAGAVAVTLARVAVVVLLAGSGWWFVEDRVVLALPLVLVPAGITVTLAVPRLARRGRWAIADRPVAVAVLATGYGAAGGIAVQYLVGYPASPVASAVVVLVVAAAAAVTWYALTGSRRLRPVVAAAAVACLAVLGATVQAWHDSRLGDTGAALHAAGGAHHHPAASITTLRLPEAVPTTRVRRLTLTARHAPVTLASGRTVDALTFDGTVPGPQIRAVQGELLEVTLRNADVDEGVTIHWHGYHVPNGDDGVAGVTQDAVRPGQSFTYRFRAEQAGTFWYHTHQAAGDAVKRGLFGTFVVTPPGPPAEPAPLDLTVPVHTLAGTTRIGAVEGLDRRAVAPGTQVRLRLVNTDDVAHRFTLHGTGFRLAAVDGVPLHEPGTLTDRSLALGAGGRHDVVFTMPPGPVLLAVDRPGQGLLLAADAATAVPPPVGATTPLDLLSYGAATPPPFGAGPRYDRRYTLVLDRQLRFLDGAPTFAHTVNGRVYPDVPALTVRPGDLVETTVVNRGPDSHPMHLHGHHVLLLERNGVPSTGSPIWLDTFDVLPGEVWRVAFRADNPGLWLDHCHNLAHAARGMVLHLAYEGVESSFGIGHATGNRPE